MNLFKKILLSSSALLCLCAAVAVTPIMTDTSMAQIQKGFDAAKTDEMGKVKSTPESLIKQVINLLLFLVGAVSVIMIIVGGFKYITSAGDTNKVSAAKNTVLYAVIGLIVAIFAWAIVTWVVGTIK